MEDQPVKRGRGRPKGSKNRPKVAATPAPPPGGITAQLRERVKAELQWCECCNRPRRPVSELARGSGVSEAILSRFLSEKRAGISSTSIDRLWTYLNREDAP